MHFLPLILCKTMHDFTLSPVRLMGNNNLLRNGHMMLLIMSDSRDMVFASAASWSIMFYYNLLLIDADDDAEMNIIYVIVIEIPNKIDFQISQSFTMKSISLFWHFEMQIFGWGEKWISIAEKKTVQKIWKSTNLEDLNLFQESINFVFM